MEIEYYNFYKYPNAYLRIFSKEKSFLGKEWETFHAERYVDGRLIEKFKIAERIVGNFCQLYKNLFYLANRKPNFTSKTNLKNRLKPFIHSEIYQKMLGWFLGGLHIRFYDNNDGFKLTSNYEQFVLIADNNRCAISFTEKDLVNYKVLENGRKINATITREEGELFLCVIGLKFFYNNNFVPILLNREPMTKNVNDRNSIYLIEFCHDIHIWSKSIAYEVIDKYINDYYD